MLKLWGKRLVYEPKSELLLGLMIVHYIARVYHGKNDVLSALCSYFLKALSVSLNVILM